MAPKKSSKTLIVVISFIVIWFIFIGILYFIFKNRPLIEYSVVNGVIGEPKGFIEAMNFECICGSVIWLILLVVAIILAERKKKKNSTSSYIDSEPLEPQENEDEKQE